MDGLDVRQENESDPADQSFPASAHSQHNNPYYLFAQRNRAMALDYGGNFASTRWSDFHLDAIEKGTEFENGLPSGKAPACASAKLA